MRKQRTTEEAIKLIHPFGIWYTVYWLFNLLYTIYSHGGFWVIAANVFAPFFLDWT